MKVPSNAISAQTASTALCERRIGSQTRMREEELARGNTNPRYWGLVSAAALAACVLSGGATYAAEPITIGFGMALTGGLAAAGKTALLAMQIWRDDVNAKGGLLGRPVKLVFYDDQTSPPSVPAIYTKLLEIDKVDLIVSGYGTNLIAPAMPVAIANDRLFLGLFGMAV